MCRVRRVVISWCANVSQGLDLAVAACGFGLVHLLCSIALVCELSWDERGRELQASIESSLRDEKDSKIVLQEC
jgi:hypothetical protein